MHLIDESMAIRPAINNTWFIALIRSVVNRFGGPKPPRAEKEKSLAQNGETTTNNDVKPDVNSDDDTSSHDSEPSSKKGESKVKIPTVKAGGMRRKNLRKR